ncbi:cathelicidin-related peptide-like [Ranitomeya imitator]|uniref:cathelicidin-related peptide-like n=1 Tax=Ranitomeya imitator TaxID=111125 RepID=UPI0037E7978A
MEKLLLPLVLATMVLARPPAPTFPQDNALELIMAAVDFYNGESHSDNMFRLYKDEYDYKEGPTGEKQANFTIKETVCQKSKNETLDSCEFHLGGLEKSCRAKQKEQEAALSVVCLTVAPGINPGNQNADSPEQEASDEDQVIIMDESGKTLEEEEKKEKRDQDAFKAAKPENTGDNHLIEGDRRAGRRQGRLCLQCVFDAFSRH